MGNEASSVRIHSALTADDIKGLRNGFPGGGNGPAPSDLNFGLWGNCWPLDERRQIEAILKKEDVITFHAYQELAGTVVRGTTEDRVKFLFKLLDRAPDKTIKSEELAKFAQQIISIASKIVYFKSEQPYDDSGKKTGEILGHSLMHELVFSGEQPKTCLRADIPLDIYLDFDMIERWLVMKCRLFEEIYLFTLAESFGISMGSSMSGISKPVLLPLEGPKFGHNTKLTPEQVIFLNSQLGGEFRSKWRPIFNAKSHGESFAKFSAAIQSKGPTLVIVWEENGFAFGGFASESWRLGPKFYGSTSCFLFNLSPKMYAYETARFNTNYMYFNLKQKTMPNGLGFGGQLEFFGFWLDSEYGRGKCAPSCTSYQSPQLSKEENFHYNHLEVWGVGEEPDLDEDMAGGSRSALDLDPEAQAVMEMMGKTFVSKSVKAEEEQMEKEKLDKEKNEAIQK